MRAHTHTPSIKMSECLKRTVWETDKALHEAVKRAAGEVDRHDLDTFRRSMCGDADAMADHAEMILSMRALPPPAYAVAVCLLEQAAKTPSVANRALYHLAMCHYHGVGAERNAVRAREVMREASFGSGMAEPAGEFRDRLKAGEFEGALCAEWKYSPHGRE